MLQRIKVTCPRPRSYKVADPGFDSACVALNFTHRTTHNMDRKR